MSKLFYMQNGFSGNDILWWKKDGKGYTTDVSQAHIFTKDEAQSQHNCREEDIPWPKDYIDQRIQPTVSLDRCDRKEALKGTGVKIKKPKPIKKDTYNCPECGRFMSEYQFHTGCPQCKWF